MATKEQAMHLYLMHLASKKISLPEIERSDLNALFMRYMESSIESLEMAKQAALHGDKEQSYKHLANMVAKYGFAVMNTGGHARLFEDRERNKALKTYIKKISDDFYTQAEEMILKKGVDAHTDCETLSEGAYILMKASQKQAIKLGVSKAVFEQSILANLTRLILNVYINENGAKDYIEAQRLYQADLTVFIEETNSKSEVILKELKSFNKANRAEIEKRLFA